MSVSVALMRLERHVAEGRTPSRGARLPGGVAARQWPFPGRGFGVFLDALREAGLPEWPFGFHGDELYRLKGAEIAAIVMGKVLRGTNEPTESLAIMQVQDGRQAAAFRSAADDDRDGFCQRRPPLRAERKRIWPARLRSGLQTCEAH